VSSERRSNSDRRLPAAFPGVTSPAAAVEVRRHGVATRIRAAEHAPEAVAERRTVEGVQERIDGRVGVAEPQNEQIDAVVDGRGHERLEDEHGEVRHPAHGERHHHRRYCHHRFPFAHNFRHLVTNIHRARTLGKTDDIKNCKFGGGMSVSIT